MKTFINPYYRKVKSLAQVTLGVLCLALVALSCRQDDVIERPKTEEITTSFELLSVRSFQKGTHLELDADLLFQEDMRAISFSENDATGELVQPTLGQEEQLHIFLRKQGDDASLAMATLTWKGRGQNKLHLEKIRIALPAGYNVNTGEQWYAMGILWGH